MTPTAIGSTALVLLALLSACSEIVSSETAAGAGAGGGGGVGGEGGSGGTADCAAFHDETSLGAVEIVVKNQRATAVYLPNETCYERFKIAPASAAPATADLSGVSLTCESVQNNEGYPLDCLEVGVVTIEPAASVKLSWSGLLYAKRTDMPPSCAKNPQNPFAWNCLQGKVPEPGTLTLTVSLYAEAVCEAGACHSGSQPFEATQTFTYPASGAVEVTVD
jgi:hypothetical protein